MVTVTRDCKCFLSPETHCCHPKANSTRLLVLCWEQLLVSAQQDGVGHAGVQSLVELQKFSMEKKTSPSLGVGQPCLLGHAGGMKGSGRTPRDSSPTAETQDRHAQSRNNFNGHKSHVRAQILNFYTIQK